MVVTNCNSLVYALNKINLNPKIARWSLKLQDYTFKVKYRIGCNMAHVDVLSRIIAYIEAMPIEKELQYRQLQAHKLKTLAKDLTRNESNDFKLFDGLVYRKSTLTPRFVVPEQMIHNIIRYYHDNMAHCNFEKTVQRISANYWFPSLKKRVKNYIENCIVCLMTDSSMNSREGNMQITDTPLSLMKLFT